VTVLETESRRALPHGLEDVIALETGSQRVIGVSDAGVDGAPMMAQQRSIDADNQ
jgi:hypothetical protein